MELSRCQRLLYVVAAFWSIALMGGAVYGWPSMRPVLKREGALRSECGTIPSDQPCDAQELSFGLVFTVGSWGNQGGRFFVGILLDRMGPRWTSCLCTLVCSVGAVLFAFAANTPLLSIGYFCIGVGGAGMQLALQSVSALFPQNKGLVMAMLSGAFQAASAVFLLMETIHRFTDVRLRTLMLGYAGVLLVVAIACVFLWPKRPFGTSAPKVSKDSSQTQSADTVAPAAASELPLNKRSFREQALSPEYLLMTTFFALTVLQCQFTIGTIGSQFEIKGDSGNLTRSFNLIFSLSWSITPFVGHMIDRLGYARNLVIMNTVLLLSCVGLLIPWKSVQIATAVLYTVGRVSIWATFFGFNGFVFGFQNYGKLAGGGLFIASCVSLLQYPFLELTLGVFDGNFAYVNAFWIGLHATLYPIILRLACRLKKQQSLPKSNVTPDVEESQSDVGTTSTDNKLTENAGGAAVAEPEVNV